jgi:MFS superfamily sulfate permease-like transporter
MTLALLILALVALLILLVVLKVLSILVSLVAIVVLLAIVAWWFDRGRAPGAPAPYRDANRPDFYGGSSESTWEVPTPYIDHPTGAGEPPGVDRGDEPAPRR